MLEGDMDRIDPGGAVALMRDLIRVEAFRSGIKASAIDVPADIHSNDGGIDGVVKDATNGGDHGIVKKGRSSSRRRCTMPGRSPRR